MAFFSNVGTGTDREYFFENLSMLLSAGIDVATALSSLEKGVRTRRMKQIIGNILAHIDEGEPLSKAISREHLLSAEMLHLLTVGEQSGKLSENLTVIVNQIRKEKMFRSKLMSAMLYPLFVSALTVIVGLGIAWFLLPNLATVFGQLRIPLPLITRILIGVGAFLGTYGVVVVPGAVVGLTALTILFFTFDPMKHAGQRILFGVPGIRSVIQEIELGRFGYIVGSLLVAGIPFPEALTILAQTTGNWQYKRMYQSLRDSVVEGAGFAKSMKAYPHSDRFIPIPIQQLVASAETSGSLPETLVHIGELSDEKIDIVTKNLSTLLEPVLLVVVWLGVLWVAIAVILPLYSLIGGINNGTP